jgi:hypothetical protein
MVTGIALTIGLNAVDPQHYAGWSGELNACEADAEDMAAIGASCRFKVDTLLTKAATRGAVKKKLGDAARTLKGGDILLLSYSGHGGQLPDMNDEEPDGQDETWCLYDGEMVDDELYTLFGKFAKGVRILMLTDCCHSGTVAKNVYFHGTVGGRALVLDKHGVRYRAMPPDAAQRTYRANREMYDKILQDPNLKEAKAAVKASVLLISGCQDNQLSSDGDFNGLFTGQMLRVWKNGMFKGDYRKFHRDIVKRMPPDQTPNYFRTGAADPAFEAQKPFTV